eukprot:3124468-Rhodomonas_salina.1
MPGCQGRAGSKGADTRRSVCRLTEVKRNHPLLKEFTPLPFEETAGGEKALEEEAAASAKVVLAAPSFVFSVEGVQCAVFGLTVCFSLKCLWCSALWSLVRWLIARRYKYADARVHAQTPAPIEIEERFRPHHSMYGTLFPDDRQAAVYFASCERSAGCIRAWPPRRSCLDSASVCRYYSAQECRTVLSEYIEKEGLVDPMKEGSIVLDPHLCDALFQGESHDGPLPTHLQRHEVVKRFAARLNAFFLMQVFASLPRSLL